MTTGFRVLKRQRTVATEWVERFRGLPVANISDCMHRMSAGQAALRPMHSGTPLAGVALTVRTRPGDNLMVHKALNMAGAGDVIVVDAGGDMTNAIIGEIMSSFAQKKGVAGFVINGAIRDAGAIRAADFPIFATGATHRGPYKDGPGEINVPISIGGMIIEPGDLVLGDDDGVLAIPFDDVARLHAATVQKQESEAKQMAAIAAGTNDRSWVDAALKRLGCTIEE